MAADERTVREQKRACALVALGVAFPVAMSIARAELEREGRLVHALRCASAGHEFSAERETCICAKCGAWRAVNAYEAEFAPPQRTVEEVLGEMKRVHESGATDLAGAAEKQRRVNELLAEALLALKKGGAS